MVSSGRSGTLEVTVIGTHKNARPNFRLKHPARPVKALAGACGGPIPAPGFASAAPGNPQLARIVDNDKGR